MKNDKAAIFTTIWIALVSIFLFEVLSGAFEKEGSPKYIKNNENGIVIKSESRNKVKYKIEDGNGNYLYSWTFPKDNRDSSKDTIKIEEEVDFNIETDVLNPKIEKLTNGFNSLVVTFSHHGVLPGKSEIELNVSDKYDDGEKLYLYYFNEDDNVLEYIDNNILVKSGYVDFSIEHCSEYVLSTSIIKGSINNPTVVKSYLFYIMIGAIILFTLRAILFKGK